MSEIRLTILVVDDDPQMLALYKNIFAHYTTYSLISIDDGEEAYEIASKQGVDLIISDISRPFPDGFELLVALRENPDTANLPFIFVTARYSTENMLKAEELGADGFLAKPFYHRDLLDRVQSLLHTRV